jgi:hypothetical protein
MALTAEQLALARQIGGLIFGSALHQGLSWDEAQGRQSRVNGRIARDVPNEAPDVNPSEVDAALRIAELKNSAPLDFDAGIVYVPGEAQNNAMYVDSPENHAAFIRQTQQEHDSALDKYLRDPRFAGNPGRAARLGIREEENLTKWWNDHDPRIPVTPSSSCVKRARIGANGDIYITFGSNPNKEYQYEGSSDPVEASRILAQLVTSDSIGRNVNSWTGFWGKAHTYLPK